jgi:uncharacterized protein HemY
MSNNNEKNGYLAYVAHLKSRIQPEELHRVRIGLQRRERIRAAKSISKSAAQIGAIGLGAALTIGAIGMAARRR